MRKNLLSSSRGVRLLRVFFCLFLSFAFTTLLAQETPATEKSKSQSKVPLFEVHSPPKEKVAIEDLDPRLRGLSQIQFSIKQISDEIKEKQAELKSAEAAGRIDEVTGQIKELSEKLENLRREFAQIAGGQSLPSTAVRSPDYSWSSEFRDLLAPLIDSLKEFTARARQVHFLKERVGYLKEEIEGAERALDRISKLEVPERLQPQLAEAKERWKSLLEQWLTDKSIASEKLKNLTSNQKSATEAIQEVFHDFFRSRGLNLILSFSGAICFWLLVSRLRRFLFSDGIKNSKASSRVLYLLLSVLLVIGTVSIFLTILFLMEDWVLLTLSGLLLIGVVWTMKDTLPRFWTQTMLLLNLGTVRESELVIVDGVPLRVKSIGFQATLDNPKMGGKVRLPINDLLDYRSRPILSDEPWFPTETGNWIIINDIYCSVKLQTPSIILVQQPGGAQVSFSTADFFSANVRNLSRGFRIQITFGIDYEHQSGVVDVIPDTFLKEVKEYLRRRDFYSGFKQVLVEFESAGASSLNLAVIVDCEGALASRLKTIERAVQSACVQACNTHDWGIPFDQLTLHVANQT